MPQSGKSKKPEIELKAFERTEWVKRKPKTHWHICAVTPDGKRAALAGWESVKFASYSKALEAIRFIEEKGGSYQAWLATRRRS